MSAPLLVTKLHIPSVRPELVVRARLIEQLNEGLRMGHRLTLISAPPGFGKTTLLSAWAAERQTGIAWLSLDAWDNDPLRFWAHLIAALNLTQGDVPPRPVLGQEALQVLEASNPSPAAGVSQALDPTPNAIEAVWVVPVLTSLLNEIAALSAQIVLVLDDYHFISAQPIHDGIAFLLDHQLNQLHLVLSTRADPPLPIVRLRARGQLTELRADDLCFTVEESAAFLDQAMGLSASPEDVALLQTRTEGWIVGLQLAALSMQGRTGVQEFLSTFTGTHHYVLEYLTEEVLNRQPEPVRRFLLQTSVLDQMCGPLCEAVTEMKDGDAMLAHLHHRNLFLVPLDEQHHWYRYHQLFGDLLRQSLGNRVPAAQVADLHRRASRWYEAHGSLDDAVQHALKAGDWEGVARVAEETIQASVLDSRLTRLLRWLQALPEDLLKSNPRLYVYHAWALFLNGQLELADQRLREARLGLQNLPPSVDNDTLRQELTRSLDTMEAIAQGLVLGLGGNIEQSIQASLKARELAEEAGDVFLAALATEGLALAHFHGGRLRQSAQFCQQVVDLSEQSWGSGRRVPRRPLAAMGYVELAGIHREWNNLDAAARYIDKAVALCQEGGGAKTLVEAYVAQSRLRQAIGDIDGAFQALRRAEETYLIEAPYSVTGFRLSTQRARLHLAVGQVDKVMDWIHDVESRFAPGKRTRALPATFREVLGTMRARVHLTQGDAELALAVLHPLGSAAEAAGRHGRVIELRLLEALARQARGETTLALEQLKQSLALAELEGYVRLYLDEGPPAAELLAAFSAGASDSSYLQAYAGKLRDAFPDLEPPVEPAAPEAAGLSAIQDPQPALIEPLTGRELEVLRLIYEGCSNREIADKLVLALNTVKRHTSNIYGKLGVSSRTQAVALARQLDLIPPAPG